MRQPDVVEGSCKMCKRDAEVFLYGKVEIFGVEKDIKVPMCREHHAEAIGNATEGLSIGESSNSG